MMYDTHTLLLCNLAHNLISMGEVAVFPREEKMLMRDHFTLCDGE